MSTIEPRRMWGNWDDEDGHQYLQLSEYADHYIPLSEDEYFVFTPSELEAYLAEKRVTTKREVLEDLKKDAEYICRIQFFDLQSNKQISEERTIGQREAAWLLINEITRRLEELEKRDY